MWINQSMRNDWRGAVLPKCLLMLDSHSTGMLPVPGAAGYAGGRDQGFPVKPVSLQTLQFWGIRFQLCFANSPCFPLFLSPLKHLNFDSSISSNVLLWGEINSFYSPKTASWEISRSPMKQASLSWRNRWHSLPYCELYFPPNLIGGSV